jgi:hypothetical protein
VVVRKDYPQPIVKPCARSLISIFPFPRPIFPLFRFRHSRFRIPRLIASVFPLSSLPHSLFRPALRRTDAPADRNDALASNTDAAASNNDALADSNDAAADRNDAAADSNDAPAS